MTRRFTVSFAMLAATVALAGCNRAAPANNVASAPVPANTAAPATSDLPTNSAAVPGNASADVPALTTAYLTGAWTKDGNCGTPDVRLNADGTTEGGHWSLRGNDLVRRTADGEDPPLTITPLGPDRMSVTFMDLPGQEMTRCPA